MTTNNTTTTTNNNNSNNGMTKVRSTTARTRTRTRKTSTKRIIIRTQTPAFNSFRSTMQLLLLIHIIILLFLGPMSDNVVYGQSTTAETATTETATTTAQQENIDEDLIDRPDPGIDFEGCYQDLVLSDRNGDKSVTQNEYLNFIQEYGKRICFSESKLTLQQEGVFIALSCLCGHLENSTSDCCLGNNAHIVVPPNAINPTNRTTSESSYLTTVCKLTDATIDARCPPIIEDRGEPIVPILPDSTVTASGGGLSDAAKWGLIAAAIALLLLMCLCCFCVWKRRRMKQEEEEEDEEIVNQIDEENVYNNKQPVIDVEQPMARNVPPSTTSPSDHRGIDSEDRDLLPARGDTAYDSDDDEEVRKKRGGGTIPSEPDEDGVRYTGAPPFPPSYGSPDPIRLRPIDTDGSEEDEWDHPGRDIQYPIDKDEISAGEVEHYDPDGGVYFPVRPTNEPSDWNRTWNRTKPEEPDEIDARKHRIQTGLGEGEVWNKLDEEDSAHVERKNPTDAFDWVIQSALGALDDTTTPTYR